MHELSQIKAMVIDMDGVLWLGNTALPGVLDLFELLNRRSIPFVLATNNSTMTPESVCSRLDTYGVRVKPSEILTSSQASAEYLKTQLPAGSLIYTIGELALRDALTRAGLKLTESAHDAQAVIVAFDRELTWYKLTEATLAIRAGAIFIGTNPDVTFPTERGQMPGTGAILAALKATTGIQPIIIGKPKPYLYLQALQRLGSEPDQTLALGDRLETDILGGQHAGMITALVLTGITQSHDLHNSPIQPDFVFNDLPQLCLSLAGGAT